MLCINRGTASATAFLILLSVAACNKKNDAGANDTTALGTTTDSQALRVSDIQVGKRIGANKRINDQTDDFAVRDTMFVSVVTDGTSTSSKLTAKWTFNDTQVVDESSQTISPAGGTTVTEFHITKASAWPKGKYKAEIMLDGASVGTKEFQVK